MTATSIGWLGDDPALVWSHRLQVEVGGAGTVARAGVVLPRLLADRLGLITGLAQVVARAGFVPLRRRGRLLVDAACALAAGATCPSDIEAAISRSTVAGQSLHQELRFRVLSAPARLVTHARRRILKIPPGWRWSPDLATAWQRLQASHPA